MSGFSTQTDPQKPAKKLEFATDKEAAVRLKVKASERFAVTSTIRARAKFLE
jgi:hypothetical protein